MNRLAALWVICVWCWLIWTVDRHLRDHRPHQ